MTFITQEEFETLMSAIPMSDEDRKKVCEDFKNLDKTSKKDCEAFAFKLLAGMEFK